MIVKVVSQNLSKVTVSVHDVKDGLSTWKCIMLHATERTHELKDAKHVNVVTLSCQDLFDTKHVRNNAFGKCNQFLFMLVENWVTTQRAERLVNLGDAAFVIDMAASQNVRHLVFECGDLEGP